MLSQEGNWTLGSCSEPFNTIYSVLNSSLLFFGFPTTAFVIVELLKRFHITRSLSPAEVFLLQVNFTNVCLFISYLMIFLDVVHVGAFSMNLFMFFHSPSLTARPVFFLAMCLIFYLAIVHPVTYMSAKTWRHWEWVVTTFGWLYALAINVAITVYKVDLFQPVFMMVFYSTILPSVYLHIAELRALTSGGSGDTTQTFNPTKRKAFRIILSMLLVLLLYYIPRVYFLVYPYVAPTDCQRFLCAEGSVIMMLPKFSEFAIPVIFLYSLRKLGV